MFYLDVCLFLECLLSALSEFRIVFTEATITNWLGSKGGREIRCDWLRRESLHDSFVLIHSQLILRLSLFERAIARWRVYTLSLNSPLKRTVTDSKGYGAVGVATHVELCFPAILGWDLMRRHLVTRLLHLSFLHGLLALDFVELIIGILHVH